MTTPNPHPDEDEVPDQEVTELEQSMPSRAAVVLRKVLFRARRVWAAIDALQAVQVTHTTNIQQLNTARLAHKDRMDALEARIFTLEHPGG